MRTMRAFGLAVALAGFWCALSAGPAPALPITYAYVGMVTSMVEDPAGVSGVQVGDGFRSPTPWRPRRTSRS